VYILRLLFEKISSIVNAFYDVLTHKQGRLRTMILGLISKRKFKAH